MSFLPNYLLPLYRALPKSKDEATSIQRLAHDLLLDERVVRDRIKELREINGVPVVALPTRNGVWIAQDAEELDSLIACQQSRLDSISHSISRLKKVRTQMSYSATLF